MVAVAVFGATGNVGSQVTTALLSALSEQAAPSDFGDKCGITNVRLVSRRAEDLQERLKGCSMSGVEVQALSVDITKPETLHQVLEGVERVFLGLPQALSSADMETVSKDFTDAAKAAGVKVVVRLSSLGIDSLGRQADEGTLQGHLGQAHVRGEEYARESGIKITSVRPTSFSSNFTKYDFASVRDSSSFASPLGHSAAVNWVTCADIGRVAASALRNPELDGKILDVTGPPSNTLTVGAMASLLSAHLGREVTYKEVPPPPFPDMEALWEFLRAGGFDVSTSTVKEVTGSEPEDFANFLKTLDFTDAAT